MADLEIHIRTGFFTSSSTYSYSFKAWIGGAQAPADLVLDPPLAASTYPYILTSKGFIAPFYILELDR